MDAVEYKNVVLLIFLNYISDTFKEHQQQVEP